MRDTGNYFVLSVHPSSAGNPLQLMRTIKPVNSTAVIIFEARKRVDQLNLPAIRWSLSSAIIHERHNFYEFKNHYERATERDNELLHGTSQKLSKYFSRLFSSDNKRIWSWINWRYAPFELQNTMLYVKKKTLCTKRNSSIRSILSLIRFSLQEIQI